MLAASIVYRAMLEIRMVRYAHFAGRIPVRPLCLTFAGAGESILAASTQSRAGGREKAFRQLVEGWVRKGGPDLAPWFADCLRELVSQVRGTTREWVMSLVPPAERASVLGERTFTTLPAEAELRLAKYEAAHTRYELPHAGSALVQLAVPPSRPVEGDEFWTLCGLEFENPRHFKLSDAAFRGTNPQVLGASEVVRSLSLGGGDLTVIADEAQI